MIELLAPVGNYEKFLTALHFGADAVYLSGKAYGLRAFADNFDNEQLSQAVKLAHLNKKKVYVTLNIFAHNKDFEMLKEYLQFLYDIKVDAVIVSDAGIISYIKQNVPKLNIHLSTQSNTTNKYAAKFWADMGIERIVLARELSLEQIKEIRDYLPQDIEIEAFVHGAMCMSYSGRCLLSNYLAGRASNKGECAQSCRWEYALVEKKRGGQYMPIEEDERGSYILNSKDMNMIEYIDKLVDCGITSFKIEGRVKSSYYVACVVNAYRRAIDLYYTDKANYKVPDYILDDLYKTGHRQYCTGFYFNSPDLQCYESSKPKQDYDFCAIVLEREQNRVLLEMRNRFKVGDELEIVSPNLCHNLKIVVGKMEDENGQSISDALNVQQKIFLYTDAKLEKFDMLRKKAN